MHLQDLATLLPGLSEAHRAIRLRLSSDQGVLDDLLLVKHVSGSETLCGHLEYRLLCVATDAKLPLKQFIALPVELQFVTDRGQLRSVCGIVAQAWAGQSDGGLATYQLVVRDALALMEQRINTRIFRNKNEIDITEILLREWRRTNPVLAAAFDVDLSHLTGHYPARELTRQHRESDAAFLKRLWKRRGISWFTRPGQASQRREDDTPAHALVLFDNAITLPQNAAGTVRYHRDSATEQRDSITAWTPVRTLRPGRLTRQSWDYKQTRMLDTVERNLVDQGTLGNQFAASLDDYRIDVPHAGEDSEDYRRLGELRMKRHEYETKCFHGESGGRELCIGEWIGLIGHPEVDTHPAQEREFILTALDIEAANNLPKDVDDNIARLFTASGWHHGNPSSEGPVASQGTEATGLRYRNRFTCVRRGTPIVPAFDARADLPPVHPVTALVVCPPGEEVHCDAQGRIKVRFTDCRPEDHDHAQGAGASGTDRDSAWIRVASNWAGAHWGMITLPRAGDEVIVEFLEGDPDKPIVTGVVHNGTAPPPDFSHHGKLPGNKYLAGIKSKEIHGSRYNQLRIDDTPDQISVQLASEHGHSQLNLGYLTHPRQNGKGEARGEGAELRSDGPIALRTAQLLLLTTQAMMQAQGKQLDRRPLQDMLESAHGLLEALGTHAEQHQALGIDLDALKKINAELKSAEQGSNTEPGSTGKGAPLIAHYAEGGFASATPYSSVNYAGRHHNLIAQQHIQFAAGQRFNVNAGKGISLFAHQDGIKHIAQYGPFDIQAQHDSIAIAAERDVTVTASQGHVRIAAQKSIELIVGGAYLKMGEGKIELGCPGGFTVKAASHNWSGPASKSASLPYFPDGEHVNWLKLDLDGYQGTPMAGVPYTLHFTDGRTKDGTLDGNGFAEEKAMPEAVDKVVYHNATGAPDPQRAASSALLGGLDAHLASEPDLTPSSSDKEIKQ